MTHEAREKKLKAANRILEIRYEMLDLLHEAKRLAKTHIESQREYANLDRYVFDQIAEFCEARNPYNKDLSNVARAIVAENNSKKTVYTVYGIGYTGPMNTEKQMKYEITDIVHPENPKLKRIRALTDFADVKAGDLGGWIESEYNLSQYGTCWVSGNAQVFGDARVSGNAQVFGDARVSGNAWVSDNSWVFGKAKVFGNAEIYDNAAVYDNAWVYDKAQVSGNAKVFGDAKVSGNAQVFGDAKVYDDTLVCDNAEVYDNGLVCGKAQVYGDAQVYGTAQVYGNDRVCGDAVVYGDAKVGGDSKVSGDKNG